MNPSGDYVDKVWGENKWAEGSVGILHWGQEI